MRIFFAKYLVDWQNWDVLMIFVTFKGDIDKMEKLINLAIAQINPSIAITIGFIIILILVFPKLVSTWNSYKDIKLNVHGASAEKSRLEILKLQLEIEVLRKTNQIENILITGKNEQEEIAANLVTEPSLPFISKSAKNSHLTWRWIKLIRGLSYPITRFILISFIFVSVVILMLGILFSIIAGSQPVDDVTGTMIVYSFIFVVLGWVFYNAFRRQDGLLIDWRNEQNEIDIQSGG